MSNQHPDSARRDAEREALALVAAALRGLPESCPDAEELGTYAECPEALASGKTLIASHLARCPGCREHVDALRAWLATPSPEAPRRLPLLPERGPKAPKVVRPWWALPKFQVPAGAAVMAGALLVLSHGFLNMQQKQVTGIPPVYDEPLFGNVEKPAVGRAGAPARKPASAPVTPKPAPVESPQPSPLVVRDHSATRSLGIVELRVVSSGKVENIGLPKANGYRLASGSEFGLSVRLGAGAHFVYVLLGDAAGAVTALFPSGPLRAGANPALGPGVLELPGTGRDWYRLDETVGQETIYVVVAEAQVDALERLARVASPETGRIEQALAGLSAPVTRFRINHVARTQ